MAPQGDKKEAILEAMLDLVVERGFHNAPMSLLAKRSGASPGVMYHYFPSKEALIHALYLRVKSAKRQGLLKGYSPEHLCRRRSLS
jgi:AcrR family transcriptional regulator